MTAVSLADTKIEDAKPPTVTDPRFELSLIATHPDIVTPVGLDGDPEGRLFVIESHTHQTNPDYPGPKHDRVKIFHDTDGDHKINKITTFADGFHHAMNLRFAPDGRLYLGQRDAVFILHDKDKDGISEGRTRIVHFDTVGDYPHNGIGGLAFSHDGWLYIGFGENLGADYTIRGSDGSSHTGGGEGGNVVRCRPDGSQIQHISTGYWNPFALEFGPAGRLFAVDNDPDASPPCRLLHVVPGSDFGYKFRYGRSGLHPFDAWNGQLPGTLPMVAGTGEAPSGILNTAKARIPKDFPAHLLVTSWGDYAIESYELRPFGASVTSERRVLVQGDEWFRPVAIVADPKGDIYFTDWVDKEYSVHQKGRLWHLALKPNVKPTAQNRPPAPPISPAEKRAQNLIASASSDDFPKLTKALHDHDPFIRSAALTALAKPPHITQILKQADHEDPVIRLGALLAARRAQVNPSPDRFADWLADPEENIRRMALIWIGERVDTAMTETIDRALTAGDVSPDLFHTYLATAQILNHASAKDAKPKKLVPGFSGLTLIEQILRDDTKPAALRAVALAMIPDSLPDDAEEKFSNRALVFLSGKDPTLATEAARTLAAHHTPQSTKTLIDLSLDSARPLDLRLEMIAALAHHPPTALTRLLPLLDTAEPILKIELARTLRPFADRPDFRPSLQNIYDRVHTDPAQIELATQLHLALYPPGVPNKNAPAPPTARPTSDSAWIAALQQTGDPAIGRRVFVSPTLACTKCHRVQGRGGQIGPDLSTIARSADRDRLIHSILNPSRDVAPRFVQYLAETKSAQTHAGLLDRHAPDGAVTLLTADDGPMSIPADDLADLRPSSLSLMPEDLELAISPQDFSHLLAFLGSLK
jgi:hypothetical protein